MSYTCQYFKFGSNEARVPGYEQDLLLSNTPYAPIPKKLVEPDPPDAIWGLAFSYASGAFYRYYDNVPGVEGATIKSWYSHGGDGPPVLAFTPFIAGKDCPLEGFAQAANFVDFSEPSTSGNSVRTDTITNPTVTATVRRELPEYDRVVISTKSTSHSIITTTTSTRVVFDHIFVYAGNCIPVDNEITVPKGQSCFALAVYKCESSSSTHEKSTDQYPKIPPWEWRMRLPEIIIDILHKGDEHIYEHLNPKVIAGMELEEVETAMSAISRRIKELEKIKSMFSGLIER